MRLNSGPRIQHDWWPSAYDISNTNSTFDYQNTVWLTNILDKSENRKMNSTLKTDNISDTYGPLQLGRLSIVMGGHGTCHWAPVCKLYFESEPNRQLWATQELGLNSREHRDSTRCVFFTSPTSGSTSALLRSTVFKKTLTTKTNLSPLLTVARYS